MPSIVAAGILYICKSTGRVLLGQRARDTDGGDGEWATFGGKVEEGETPRVCAIREVAEETGYRETHPNRLRLNYRSDVASHETRVVFYCFMQVVDKEFAPPRLKKDEHSRHGWFKPNALPTPTLPAFRDNIDVKKLMGFLKRHK